MISNRSAGILLHISSLPGEYGIGTMGKEAYGFVRLLSRKNIRYWQILPLVQTGYGDSPYQSVFSGSGNPYFIDFDILIKEGLLTENDVTGCKYEGNDIDYAFLYDKKYAVLRRAFSRFDCNSEEFTDFVKKGEFDDYALFMALKQSFGGKSFDKWPKEYKFSRKSYTDRFKKENYREYLFWQFVQYEFFRQWKALKKYANDRNVYIIGDVPLYVAYDSADVWRHPELFKLKSDLTAEKIAGVPPDYFSKTGQLWGNPVYRWSEHRKDGYSWWIERLRRSFELYDVVRLDHFRGFDRYYEVDADSLTAECGVWRKGPACELFKQAEKVLGKLNIIAEDLGVQDEGVRRLVAETGFPRMKITGFAFDGDPDNSYLPQHTEINSVCYTGTHDNDTMLGYLTSLGKGEYGTFRKGVETTLEHYGIKGSLRTKKQIVKEVIRLTLLSPSQLAVVPVQDILLLGNEARMNLPGTVGQNWKFRLKRRLTGKELKEYSKTAKFYGRDKEEEREVKGKEAAGSAAAGSKGEKIGTEDEAG